MAPPSNSISDLVAGAGHEWVSKYHTTNGETRIARLQGAVAAARW
jgi:hypothetical protein